MKVSLVVAATENNAIGKDNKLLWHLPNDMMFFKNTTWGMPVIMGRKTFDSMQKPLRGRTNIIITRQEMQAPPGTVVVNNPEQALKIAEDTDAKECFVIGGAEIFNQFLDQAYRIYMTRVQTTLDGDVFFPDIDQKEWELTDQQEFNADDKHAYAYSFQTWDRKNSR